MPSQYLERQRAIVMLLVNRTIDSSRRPKYIVESGVSSAKACLLRCDVGFNTGKQVSEDNALSSTRRDRCNRDQAIVGGVRSVALPLVQCHSTRPLPGGREYG